MFYIKDATMVEKQKLVEVPEAMETESLPTDVQLPDVATMAAGDAKVETPSVVPDGEVVTDGSGAETPATAESAAREGEGAEKQATESMEGTVNDSSSENVSSTDNSPELLTTPAEVMDSLMVTVVVQQYPCEWHFFL